MHNVNAKCEKDSRNIKITESQQKYYNVTVRNFRVIFLLKKYYKVSILCVCSHNYRAFNAQTPYNIVFAILLPTLCHIIPIISSSEQFSGRLFKHKICVLVFSKMCLEKLNFPKQL